MVGQPLRAMSFDQLLHLPALRKRRLKPSKTPFTGTKSSILIAGSKTLTAPKPSSTSREELAYTRSVLDPLPGREQIQQALVANCSPSGPSAPRRSPGNYYFYTRREGTQNQPVLLVREGVKGKDRPWSMSIQMSTDGTVALDWWFPSEDGKYVAYGTLSERLRREHVAHRRNRLRRRLLAGHHRSHPLCQRGVEERQLGLLLQPPSEERRCSGKAKRSITPRFSITRSGPIRPKIC